MPAVLISAVIFAFFHGPTDLAHWVAFTATGIAYGGMRVASGSTTAPALMHESTISPYVFWLEVKEFSRRPIACCLGTMSIPGRNGSEFLHP